MNRTSVQQAFPCSQHQREPQGNNHSQRYVESPERNLVTYPADVLDTTRDARYNERYAGRGGWIPKHCVSHNLKTGPPPSGRGGLPRPSVEVERSEGKGWLTSTFGRGRA
ncbi:hypothetical protein Poly41_43330 [Novipirellula artificiosorum]|uniref:Uncharacterized protein n=1 Tax=Novipirellula artificiosorum TaxID=2528016 RepID=A0A5C6DGS2_9BACT|nr:hypothetical protein Poly41_43330 [Novipirellula artificiosorum]